MINMPEIQKNFINKILNQLITNLDKDQILNFGLVLAATFIGFGIKNENETEKKKFIIASQDTLKDLIYSSIEELKGEEITNLIIETEKLLNIFDKNTK